MRPLLTAALFLFSMPAFAQVNTEKLRTSSDKDGTTGAIDLKLGYRSGNVEIVDTGLGTSLLWRKLPSSVFWLVSGRFASKRTPADYTAEPSVGLLDKEARFSSQLLTHLRYNRVLSDRVTWELFGQAEYNEFLLLDLRLLAGTGPRFTLLDGDAGSMHLGTAYMAEQETLNPESVAASEPQIVLAHRWSTYITGSLALSETATIKTTTYIQPRVPDVSDLRVLNESSLVLGITERLSWSVDFKLRHDSDPPTLVDGTTLKPTDTEIGNKLSVAF